MPNINLTSISNFGGGLNKDKDAVRLKLDETPESLNCEFTRAGAVRRRNGITKWSVNENVNMSMVDFLYYWRQIGVANDWLVAIDNDGDIYYSNSNDFSGAAVADYADSTPSRREFKAAAILSDVLYLTSLDTTLSPYKFDGTNWSAIVDQTLNGSGNEFPRARFLLSKHERIFAFSINNANLSRIAWSDPLDAETWQSTSWVDVDPDDGSEIQGVASFGDGIVILKDRSIFMLTGTDENSFTLYPVDTSVGTMCPKTVVEGANRVFWLDPFQGVYMFDGANVKPISDPIREYLLDNIMTSDPEIVRHSAFFYKDKYYLSVCWKGANDTSTPTRTFVYDTQLNAWTEWNIGFASAVIVDGQVYVGRPRADHMGGAATVGVYLWESGTTDNGSNFVSRFKTPWFSPSNSVNNRHRLRHATFFFTPESTSGPHNVKIFTDFDPSNVLVSGSIDSSQAGTEDEVVVELPSVGGEYARAFQIEVEESSAEPWQLNGIELSYSVREYTRGDRSV